MRSDRIPLTRLLVLLVVATGSGAAPQSPRARTSVPDVLICLPEHSATCDGLGNCTKEGKPNELAGFKIEFLKSKYSVCSRNGRDCAERGSFEHRVVGSGYLAWDEKQKRGFETQFLVLHSFDKNPDSIKIDLNNLTFAAVRVHGLFVELAAGQLTDAPRLGEITFGQTTGTCVSTS